jgi:glycosyltransferase involved in cell wall biosynthesis
VSAPLVSVVIPTRNAGPRLAAVLDRLEAQRADFPVETLAVDSGSTDGTLDVLTRRVGTLVRIAPHDFNHGTTRNAGIARARGELVVMLVQDAVPQSDDWLARLVAPLRTDERLAGAFGRQVARADASAVTRHNLELWVAAGSEPRVVFIRDRASYNGWTPMERLRACAFDNVAAVVRRTAWAHHPFVTTPIAEDVEWGRDVLLAGHGLAYVPEAVVEHSHERSAWYELRRTWVLHQQLHLLFGLRTIPTVAHLAHAVGSSLTLHYRLMSEAHEGMREYARAAALAFAWPLGQYVGGLTAAMGRANWRPGGV